MSLAIFSSFYRKISGEGVTRMSHTFPCLIHYGGDFTGNDVSGNSKRIFGGNLPNAGLSKACGSGIIFEIVCGRTVGGGSQSGNGNKEIGDLQSAVQGKEKDADGLGGQKHGEVCRNEIKWRKEDGA